MGSVLRKHGTELWNPAPGMAKRLFGHQRWIRDLTVTEFDDPANPGFIDGVVPVALAHSTTIIPGKVAIDGYDKLDAAIKNAFGDQLVEGDPLQPVMAADGSLNKTCRVDGKDPSQWGVPNYYQFAYDWRRDIRASALRLATLIDDALPALREQRSPQARVIFLTHSMGGLLARYYIEGINPATNEAFNGWQHVRQLSTYGTPHRGSLDALTHVVNGFKKLFLDFTPALLSMTSGYQLLPRYRVVFDSRPGQAPAWKYPYELGELSDFEPARAKEAYDDFHGVIQAGVDRHRGLDGYRPYYLQPLVGFGNATDNSAQLNDNGLSLSTALPDWLPAAYAGGDGTVPLVSALPREYSTENGDDLTAVRYLNQSHGSLPADKRLLAQEIAHRLAQSQVTAADAENVPSAPSAAPSIDIAHASFWLDGEVGKDRHVSDQTAGAATVTVHNADQSLVQVVIRATSPDGVGREAFTAVSGETIDLAMPPGEYQITASLADGSATSTSAFAVLAP